QTGLDADAVADAIDELEVNNVVHGYQAVVDWDRVDEGKIRAIVEINVELDRETGYEQVADRIAKFPAVDALHLVSGDYDFAVEVLGENMQDVSEFISEQVAPMPEVTQTVTHYIMETYKDGGIRFEDGDDDDRLSVSP
ncbi:AsnC family transcriptional regulator, partial [Halorubrum sp. E3]